MKYLTLVLALMLSPATGHAQSHEEPAADSGKKAISQPMEPTIDSQRDEWSLPEEPFRVIGNIYYVGASNVSSHIIDTGEGLILVDTGTSHMPPLIKANVEKLGYSLKDIKYIVSSHAHWDHVEGLAALQEMSGAEVVALGEDAVAISSGIDSSAYNGIGWTPVNVDRVIKDGEVLSLGDIGLTAHLTAGHTKGCTTWTTTVTDNGKAYKVVFIGGTSINYGVNLVDNTRHPAIAEDYARTFQLLKSLKPDVFLGQHPTMYNMHAKRASLSANPKQNPFINPDEYIAFVESEEQIYLQRLKADKAR